VLLVAVAQLAKGSTAPGKDSAVGGDGEAVRASSRDSDDTLASKGLDLLGQQLALRVAVAQLAVVACAPAPGGAIGGEGEVVALCSRHSEDPDAALRTRKQGTGGIPELKTGY